VLAKSCHGSIRETAPLSSRRRKKKFVVAKADTEFASDQGIKFKQWWDERLRQHYEQQQQQSQQKEQNREPKQRQSLSSSATTSTTSTNTCPSDDDHDLLEETNEARDERKEKKMQNVTAKKKQGRRDGKSNKAEEATSLESKTSARPRRISSRSSSGGALNRSSSHINSRGRDRDSRSTPTRTKSAGLLQRHRLDRSKSRTKKQQTQKEQQQRTVTERAVVVAAAAKTPDSLKSGRDDGGVADSKERVMHELKGRTEKQRLTAMETQTVKSLNESVHYDEESGMVIVEVDQVSREKEDAGRSADTSKRDRQSSKDLSNIKGRIGSDDKRGRESSTQAGSRDRARAPDCFAVVAATAASSAASATPTACAKKLTSQHLQLIKQRSRTPVKRSRSLSRCSDHKAKNGPSRSHSKPQRSSHQENQEAMKHLSPKDGDVVPGHRDNGDHERNATSGVRKKNTTQERSLSDKMKEVGITEEQMELMKKLGLQITNG